MNEIEDAANEAIYRNLPVKAYYPDESTLKDLSYRAKLALTENVRIVTIADVDCCACCAPHVKRTGEIGIIKLLDFIRYKGGVRIHILCGTDAVADYRKKHLVLARAASLLSAKQHETDDAVVKLLEDKERLSFALRGLQKELATEKAKALSVTKYFTVLFETEKDFAFWREFAMIAAALHGSCIAVFFGNEEDGYAYAFADAGQNAKALAKPINTALRGKGGGNEGLIQGSVSAKRKDIEDFFDHLPIPESV